MTASQERTNIYKIMDETAQTHQLIVITGKRNNMVILSEEDWNAIDKTFLSFLDQKAKEFIKLIKEKPLKKPSLL